MAKIAVELERALAERARNGTPGKTIGRRLARGTGWTVADVICTSCPQDRPFEEKHSNVNIAMVVAGTFQYRSQPSASRELMTPGSLLLGNPGDCFECGHEHGSGDRCISFGYAPEYFERVAADAGIRGLKTDFRMLRLPPLRDMSMLVSRACAGLGSQMDDFWEELGIKLAARTVQIANKLVPRLNAVQPSTVARVTQVVRRIEQCSADGLGLQSLAKEARLSPYHFLRIFEGLTGLTPHQYILRARLREAARRLLAEPTKILDVAFDCGFGDVSNFNRAFRAEFGVNPRGYRRQMGWRSKENASL